MAELRAPELRARELRAPELRARPNFGRPNFGWPNFGRPNFGHPNFGWAPELRVAELRAPELRAPELGSRVCEMAAIEFKHRLPSLFLGFTFKLDVKTATAKVQNRNLLFRIQGLGFRVEGL